MGISGAVAHAPSSADSEIAAIYVVNVAVIGDPLAPECCAMDSRDRGIYEKSGATKLGKFRMSRVMGGSVGLHRAKH